MPISLNFFSNGSSLWREKASMLLPCKLVAPTLRLSIRSTSMARSSSANTLLSILSNLPRSSAQPTKVFFNFSSMPLRSKSKSRARSSWPSSSAALACSYNCSCCLSSLRAKDCWVSRDPLVTLRPSIARSSAEPTSSAIFNMSELIPIRSISFCFSESNALRDPIEAPTCAPNKAPNGPNTNPPNTAPAAASPAPFPAAFSAARISAFSSKSRSKRPLAASNVLDAAAADAGFRRTGRC
mmetsp:Transcript_24155/g.69444  ORF Transcript_24155/g.69444 Transcript_24155/m.69444 type:complete len:240 (-) Transcript_24155:211-930(-)